MAVSTDTIQMLLRQRQDLREALLDLRKEIEELDATSLDLVNKNIKSPAGAAPETTGEATAAAPADASSPPTASSPEPVSPPVQAPASAAVTSPASVTSPTPAPVPVSPAPAPLSSPAAGAATPLPGTEQERPEETDAKEAEKEEEKNKEKGKRKEADAPRPVLTAHGGDKDRDEDEDGDEAAASDDLDDLLLRAQALAHYFLDHPGPVPAAELGALDSAIAVCAKARTAPEKTACYHTLRAAYRKVASASYGQFGINGVTLVDSRMGARLLWALPLAITLLLLVFFPLVMIARTVTGEMFNVTFANDLSWTLSAMAAFLWGASGALTLLALTVAFAICRRRYDADIRRSPFLKAALGGLLGAGGAMTLAIWLPPGTVGADLSLDLTAFLGGLVLAAPLFAGLQRLIQGLTNRIEASLPPPARKDKK